MVYQSDNLTVNEVLSLRRIASYCPASVSASHIAERREASRGSGRTGADSVVGHGKDNVADANTLCSTFIKQGIEEYAVYSSPCVCYRCQEFP